MNLATQGPRKICVSNYLNCLNDIDGTAKFTQRCIEEMEEGNYEDAWERLDRILGTQWSYEMEPQILWAAYVASESARMDDGLVESYLRTLDSEYPHTEEGAAAIERLGGSEGEGGG